MKKVFDLYNYLKISGLTKEANLLAKYSGNNQLMVLTKELGIPAHKMTFENAFNSSYDLLKNYYDVDELKDILLKVKNTPMDEYIGRHFSTEDNTFLLLGYILNGSKKEDFEKIKSALSSPSFNKHLYKIDGKANSSGGGIDTGYRDINIGKSTSKKQNREAIASIIGEDVDLSNIDGVREQFKKLLSKVEESSKGDYKTRNIIYDFKNGYVMVDVPGAGEVEPWDGDPKTSYDRVLEGNKQGLCLGSKLRYHQDPKEKVFSIRNELNEPFLTVTVVGNSLKEVRGKDNKAPNIPLSKMFVEFLNNTDYIKNYKDNETYQALPPLTEDKALKDFDNNERDFVFRNAFYWYREGKETFKNNVKKLKRVDDYIDEMIESKDCEILISGLAQRFKDLLYDIAKECSQNIDSFYKIYNHANMHNTWKVYRKEPWMQESVKKLLDSDKSDLFFTYEMFRIDEFVELGRPYVAEFLNNFSEETIRNDELLNQEKGTVINFILSYYKSIDVFEDLDECIKYLDKNNLDYYLKNIDPEEHSYSPYSFFMLGLDKKEHDEDIEIMIFSLYPAEYFELGIYEKYPEYSKYLDKMIRGLEKHEYFKLGLDEKHPEYLNEMLKKISEYFYFELGLDEKYPEYLEVNIKKLEKKDYFELGLDEKYPEYLDAKIKNMGTDDYFKLKLDEKYPKYLDERLKILMTKWEDFKELEYFNLGLDEKYPEYLDKMISYLRSDYYFKYYLDDKYPEYLESKFKDLEKYDYFKLHLDDKYPEYLEKNIIELDSDYFYSLGLDKKYPDYEMLRNTNKYKFFIDGLDEKYPKYIDEMLKKINSEDYFKLNLDKKYPQYLTEGIKRLYPFRYFELKLDEKYNPKDYPQFEDILKGYIEKLNADEISKYKINEKYLEYLEEAEYNKVQSSNNFYFNHKIKSITKKSRYKDLLRIKNKYIIS